MHCPLFDDKIITFLSTLNKIDCKVIETNESYLIERLLFGNSLFDLKKNSLILNATIDYILSTERFKELLLQQVLITTTKYSCRSNHSFILLEFFNLLYLYLYLVTCTFFCYSQVVLELFDAQRLQFLVYFLLNTNIYRKSTVQYFISFSFMLWMTRCFVFGGEI